MVLNYRPGTVLFYVPYYENAVEDAKDFCREKGLTPDDVRIIKTDECVLVKRK